MSPIRTVSVASAIGIVVLVVMIVVSALEMPLSRGLRETADSRWGITTLVDLYIGLFVVGAWIAYRERSAWRSVLWWIALCLTGNLTTVVYLLLASLRSASIGDLFRPVRR